MKQLNKKRKKRRSVDNYSIKEKKKGINKRKKRPNNKKRSKIKTVKEPSLLAKVIKTSFSCLYYIIVIVLLVSATLFALNRDSNKSYFGFRFFTVLTDSMVSQKDSPPGGFNSGDMIIIQSIDVRQIKKDDIVTFTVGESQDKFLTHRVVDKLTELNGEEGDFLVTRGDANNADDPPFNTERVIGKKIYTIPNVGFIAEFVRGNLWICLTFVFSLFGFLLVIRYYFFGKSNGNN